jgi:hypothetical protein
MKASTAKKISFQTKLESISDEMEYYAVSVPAKITESLKTRGPVPVSAQFNGSAPYRVNLYPVGGGRHSIRIKAEIRKAAKLKESDRIRVDMYVVDRTTEITIPKDLAAALREEGLLAEFKAISIGKKSFILRNIEKAAKPETRAKRIQEAVEEAYRKKERD